MSTNKQENTEESKKDNNTAESPDVNNETQTDAEEQQEEANEEKEEVKETTEQIQEEAKEQSLEAQVEESKNKYMRLYAEFENFRRRTIKEKSDLIKNAGAGIMEALLPILDDFDRANKSMEESNDFDALKEGLKLVHEKLTKTLENKGLKLMESSIGQDFNVDLHESITQIPAPSEDMKGKVIDEIEKGYYLNDKILRFAKVVVGS